MGLSVCSANTAGHWTFNGTKVTATGPLVGGNLIADGGGGTLALALCTADAIKRRASEIASFPSAAILVTVTTVSFYR